MLLDPTWLVSPCSFASSTYWCRNLCFLCRRTRVYLHSYSGYTLHWFTQGFLLFVCLCLGPLYTGNFVLPTGFFGLTRSCLQSLVVLHLSITKWGDNVLIHLTCLPSCGQATCLIIFRVEGVMGLQVDPVEFMTFSGNFASNSCRPGFAEPRQSYMQ